MSKILLVENEQSTLNILTTYDKTGHCYWMPDAAPAWPDWLYSMF